MPPKAENRTPAVVVAPEEDLDIFPSVPLLLPYMGDEGIDVKMVVATSEQHNVGTKYAASVRV
jgi:hypothetical protein